MGLIPSCNLANSQYPEPKGEIGMIKGVPLWEDLARRLFQHRAIKFGAFKLRLHETNPDAPLSPIYVDLRVARSFPVLMDTIVLVLRRVIQAENLKFDYLADVPTAATPIVAIMSYQFRIPMVTPREAKTHGSRASIDGSYESGRTALLVDDLVTKADSKIAAIRVLEEGGLIVRDVIVLVDREQGGAEQLARAGYTLHRACTLRELLDFYLEEQMINQELYDKVISYLEANRS